MQPQQQQQQQQPSLTPQQPLPANLAARTTPPRPVTIQHKADAPPPKPGHSGPLLVPSTVQRLATHVGGPKSQVGREVEAVLNDLVEGFVDSALTFGANMAAQRNSRSVEPKDIAVHLERSWHVSVPGYTSLDPNRPVKRPPPSRLHRNRAAAVRRQLAEAAPEDVAVHGGEEVTMR